MAKQFFQAILFALLAITSLSFQIRDYSWKYFVYSQWWPQSQCYYKHTDNLQKDQWRVNNHKFTNSCVPEEVNTWTIHGLWPTLHGTPEPVYCNNSWPFDKAEIESLRPQMMKQWLAFPDSSESNSAKLWKHEWEKHGTCSVMLPALNSEYNYFSKGLALNMKYDLLRDLKIGNIVPTNDKQYNIEDVENAIRKVYGIKGRVICVAGPGDVSYLGGVRICLDKSFSPIDCIVTEPEKCRGDTVAYPTILR